VPSSVTRSASPPDDPALAGGDRSAEGGGQAGPVDLDAAYREFAPRVARWAERLAGPGFDVEDVVHDVFLVAQRRLPEWRGEAKLSTWLYEITIRVVQRRRRTRGRWRLLPWRRSEADVGWTASALPAPPAPTPVELLERRMTTALLYELLDGLDDKYRTPLILFELEGMPGREIATVTGTSVGNVWVRIMRARAELARRMEARERKGAA
jgi:RNA polymerase sigma-70 factor (ECF subfamily)